MAPRIAPLPATGNPPDIQAFLDSASAATGGAINVFLTLGRHPGLLRKYLPFAGKLLNAGTLDDRTRELVILRTAWICGSEYEWAQHVRIGRDAGLTDEEITRVAGPVDDAWTGPEQVVLRATDQLLEDHDLDDATWAALGTFLDERQVIELTVLPGAYALLAAFLNATRVEREPGTASFPPGSRP